MSWSPEQDRALREVDQWMADPNGAQVFRLFGFAGTGKTTLAREVSENIDGEVLFGAFTGKAAHVLRQKGCENASTLHSLIYHTRDKGQARLKDLEAQLVKLKSELGEDGASEQQVDDHPRVRDIRRLIEKEREALAQPTFLLNHESALKDARLLICDEGSTVDDRLGEDVLSFGTRVLVLGDPAQLPPVRGEGFFTTGAEPDIMLTEVHRQARDNPIIELATKVRMGEKLPLGQYGESAVVDAVTLSDKLDADQLIVGRNKTRHAINRQIREALGYQERHPIPGDRLICLRNDHEVGLLNGAIWFVEDIGLIGNDRSTLHIVSDDTGDRLLVEVHMHHFQGRGEALPWWERKEAQEFDYGYAITCHKAQGSQWSGVMVYDESWCFREDRHKWLYTAITRAADRLTLVRN